MASIDEQDDVLDNKEPDLEIKHRAAPPKVVKQYVRTQAMVRKWHPTRAMVRKPRPIKAMVHQGYSNNHQPKGPLNQRPDINRLVPKAAKPDNQANMPDKQIRRHLMPDHPAQVDPDKVNHAVQPVVRNDALQHLSVPHRTIDRQHRTQGPDPIRPKFVGVGTYRLGGHQTIIGTICGVCHVIIHAIGRPVCSITTRHHNETTS
jgi:hypothetical protein